jgi:serine phosphatase RsbU (regulator of sigma subunit)
MYFGGANGYNIFRPTTIKDNLNAPRTYVVNYKRAGNDVLTDSIISYKKQLALSWSENYFQFELVALDYTDPAKNKFKYKLEGYDKDWSAPTNVRYVSYTEVPGGEYTFMVKAANNDGIWNETPYEIRITIVPPFWKTKLFYFLVLLFAGASIYAYTTYRTNAIKKENKILENKVAERTRELAEKNRDITSSIEYAKRIQEAILPPKEHIFNKLNGSFILYRPKDIVSGDFYWFGVKSGWKIFAVVDCTGHGVPGAFMSMIGHNLLHQIIQEKGVTDPGEVLNHLHKGVQESLRQGQNEINTNDGMDVSIISINEDTREIRWSGANRPLVIIDVEGNFVRYDGNKFPVGGAQIATGRFFVTHQIKVSRAAMAYMFSDGYADQFGGDKGKKFMVKRFHEILSNIHMRSPEEQKKELELNFAQWRQNHEQVDDVLVVGIAI